MLLAVAPRVAAPPGPLPPGVAAAAAAPAVSARADARPAPAAHRPTLARRLLGVPLPAKLLGANALLLLAAVVAFAGTYRGGGPGAGAPALALFAVALAASAAANVALVRLALRPLRDLEATAERVWRGDLAARVPPSPVADRDVARVGRAFNLVLDGLVDDQARLRRLAAEVIRAGDRERAHVARELHDSAAQTLAAATYQLAALSRDAADGVAGPALAERAEAARALVAGVLEEVRLLAHTVYPQVLDDLGLPGALHTLGHRAREHAAASGHPADVEVIVDAAVEALPRTAVSPAAASVLYRVAQESVTNALRHGRPHCLTVVLRAGEMSGGGALHGAAPPDDVYDVPPALTLEVSDDGAGFDVADADARRPGMGLFVMRERVALAGGRFAVTSAPGDGARVHATVPLTPSAAEPPTGGRSARAPRAALPLVPGPTAPLSQPHALEDFA